MAQTAEPVRRARLAAGLSQAELARRSGISRQALGAIEAGAYQPGVAVALRLCRALGATVEELFGGQSTERIEAAFKGEAVSRAVAARPHVALGRVSGRVVAIPQPAAAYRLAPAAGIVERAGRRRATIDSFRSTVAIDSTLLVAGCDPSAAILGDWLARQRPPVTIGTLSCPSSNALDALVEGRVHAAGLHLRDRRSGEYNLRFARRRLGRRRGLLVNFARWELGVATTPGNPLGITGLAELGRQGLRLVNREPGSGARLVLDEALREQGFKPGRVCGYEREVGGHLEVASAITVGQADFGITIRVAAEAYGLGFIPLREERYDMVILESEIKSPPVKAMLEAMNSDRFARELGAICGYDTSAMGQVIARIG